MLRFYYDLRTPTRYEPLGGFVEELYGGVRPGNNPLLRRSKEP
jgi:hypothetical protein